MYLSESRSGPEEPWVSDEEYVQDHEWRLTKRDFDFLNNRAGYDRYRLVRVEG